MPQLKIFAERTFCAMMIFKWNFCKLLSSTLVSLLTFVNQPLRNCVTVVLTLRIHKNSQLFALDFFYPEPPKLFYTSTLPGTMIEFPISIHNKLQSGAFYPNMARMH